jgi:hypothetical protein
LCVIFDLEAVPQSCREITLKRTFQSRYINISLWVIELPGKKGSNSAVFERVEGKLLCVIFDLEAVPQSCREITLKRIF